MELLCLDFGYATTKELAILSMSLYFNFCFCKILITYSPASKIIIESWKLKLQQWCGSSVFSKVGANKGIINIPAYNFAIVTK